MTTTDREFADQISDALFSHDEETCEETIDSTSSFQEAGLLTNDVGIVVRMTNGSEFQVTVTKTN